MATVLVIEDDPLFRELVCEVLKHAGHETIEADDGIRGVAAVSRRRPDLVITDIMMPEQEGIETIQRILELYDGLPIIAISGNWGSGDYAPLDDARMMGAAAALEKPVEMSVLLAEVAKLVGPQPH